VAYPHVDLRIFNHDDLQQEFTMSQDDTQRLSMAEIEITELRLIVPSMNPKEGVLLGGSLSALGTLNTT
jgi:hypothetical protein